MMELQSQEVIERFKEKIPQIKNVDHTMFGITQLDIICDDKKTIKQYVLAFERLKVIEPTEFLTIIYADVYVRIKDETLYKIATKEISLEHALTHKLFKVYGDKEIWQLQLKALKEILPNEQFKKKITEEIVEESEEEIEFDREKDEEWKRRTDLSTIPPELKFLADALAEIHKRM